jgi:TatD DNase family protein
LADSQCTPVMHWFTGTAAEARRAVDLGCYFSINAQMLASAKALRTVQTLPRDRLLTETDGPFVAFGNRPSRPGDVPDTVRLLAGVLGLSLQEVTGTVVFNLGRLVRPSSSCARPGGRPFAYCFVR